MSNTWDMHLVTKTLLGELTTTSDYLNVNSFMVDMEDEEVASTGNSTESMAFRVPPDIDFKLSSTF